MPVKTPSLPPLKLHLKKIEQSGSQIIMVARDAAGKRWTVQVAGFRPYFYVEATPENEKSLKKRGLEYEPGRPSIFGDETFRVFTDTPGDVGRRRRGFHGTNCAGEKCRGCGHFEADVPYTRRFLVDSGIHDGFIVRKYQQFGETTLLAHVADLEPAMGFRVKDRQMLYDIETNKPEGSRHYSPPTQAKGAITALTLQDSYDGTNFHTYIWHPEFGHAGRPREEIRTVFSEGFNQNVQWVIHWYGTESEMMRDYVSMLKRVRPDIMQAWNGHHGFHKKNKGGFDAPYIINRCRNIGIAPGQLSPMGGAWAGYKNFGKETKDSKGKWQCTIDGTQLIDSMTVYQIKEGGFPGTVPFSDLLRVCKKVTDKRKDGGRAPIILKKDPSAIENWWLNNTEEFLRYSFRDVDAMVGMELEEHYADFARDIQQFVGCEEANRLFTPMSLITTLLLRLAKEDGVCIPTSDSEREDYEAEGGFVLDPRIKGLQRWVGVLDLAMMYVNNIISGNLSPETHVPDPDESQMGDLICVPSDMGPQFFLKPSVKVGLLPKACRFIKRLREQYDEQIAAAKGDAAKVKDLKKQRNPVKQLLLAIFGTSLSKYFALYAPPVGSSITGMGRYIATETDGFVQTLGDMVHYQDTDSVFTPLPADDPVGHGEWLAEQINARFDVLAETMNMDEHSFEIGLEKIYDPFVQGNEKKMYAGYIVWSEGEWVTDKKTGERTYEFEVAGLQGVKTDAAPLTKEVTDAVLKAILNGATEEEIVDYLTSMYDGLLAGEVPLPDIIKAVNLGADPDDPKAPNSYIITAARNGRSMYDFEYQVGERVRLLKLKGGDETWVAVPATEDLPEEIAVDWDHHAQISLLSPLRTILSWVDMDSHLDSIKHGSEPSRQKRL